MQNAKCKQDVVCSSGVNVATTFTPLSRTWRTVCILHFAFCIARGLLRENTTGAGRTPPQFDTTQQLQNDLTAATKMPGVQRATWGIAVQSLARNERLFDLNPRTLMVPASVAKLVSVATAVDAVGWDYRFTTTLRAAGPVEARHPARRSARRWQRRSGDRRARRRRFLHVDRGAEVRRHPSHRRAHRRRRRFV